MAKTYVERRSPCTTDTQYKVNLSGYQWASRFAVHFKNCVILDVACGMGYGAYYLSEMAFKVIGIDISSDAVGFCKKEYNKNNLEFMHMDCTDLKFPDNAFDMIISQDTIEHIRDDNKFLFELRRVLKHEGMLVIFTPLSEVHNEKPENIYHIREYSLDSFKKLLSGYFPKIRLYGRKKGGSLLQTETCLNKIRRFDKWAWREKIPRKIRHGIANFILKVSGNKTLGSISFPDIEYFQEINGAETIIAVLEK